LLQRDWLTDRWHHAARRVVLFCVSVEKFQMIHQGVDLHSSRWLRYPQAMPRSNVKPPYDFTRELSRVIRMKKPSPHLTKWTVFMGTKLMRFDTLEEAQKERDKAVERGQTAWIQPPLGVRT
jgi:hypothetical protein